MKLKHPEQMLYLRSMGKVLLITAIFTDENDVNAYMEKHKGEEGVIAQFGPYIFLANMRDKGVPIPKAY